MTVEHIKFEENYYSKFHIFKDMADAVETYYTGAKDDIESEDAPAEASARVIASLKENVDFCVREIQTRSAAVVSTATKYLVESLPDGLVGQKWLSWTVDSPDVPRVDEMLKNQRTKDIGCAAKAVEQLLDSVGDFCTNSKCPRLVLWKQMQDGMLKAPSTTAGEKDKETEGLFKFGSRACLEGRLTLAVAAALKYVHVRASDTSKENQMSSSDTKKREDDQGVDRYSQGQTGQRCNVIF